MRYFIVTTRGLEDIVRDELIERLPQARLGEPSYRRVLLEAAPEAASVLLELRCADDAFVAVAEWNGIHKGRSALELLSSCAAAVGLTSALELCEGLRRIAHPVRFAVSASFVGRRNYSSPEMKLALAEGVMQRYDWRYIDEEVADGLSLRLFIEHEQALLGVRLAAQPLHRRPYKLATIPGSLRASVAAALLRLASAQPGDFCVDPLCGAGTVVIEAALMGVQALGGDSSAEVLAIARANLAASRARAELRQWDATALPLAANSVDCVATNLPFGRQVSPDAELATLYMACVAEIGRVLRPGGKAALLTSRYDEMVAALEQQPALSIVTRREISLHGQTPTVWLVQKGR